MSISRENRPDAKQEYQQPKPLYKNIDYLLLSVGQGISDTGSQISGIAFPLLTLALTHSPAQAGIVGAVGVIPFFILSIPAGAFVDRWDRKHIMIICNIIRAINLLVFIIALASGHIHIIQFYIAALVEGVLAVFFSISFSASIARIVPKKDLSQAMSQRQIIFNLSFLLGPPIGGALYSIKKFFPFLADTISYIISVISLFFIKTPLQEHKNTAPLLLIWKEIVEAGLWVWQHPTVRFMMLFTGAYYLLEVGVDLIVIVLAQQQMHASAFIIGLIIASGSVGGVIGALIAPFVHKRFSFGQLIIGIYWVAALQLFLFAFTPNLLVLGLLLALYFPKEPIYAVVVNSHLVSIIPDNLQGRVNSIFSFIPRGSQATAMVLVGILIQSFGTSITALVCSAGLGLLAIAAMLNPYLRNVRPLVDPKTLDPELIASSSSTIKED